MRLRTKYTHRFPTAPGLRLDIPMFEGSGSKVSDLSGKGNHGTITDAVWTRDENGVAMSFNGTSAYINCGNDPSLDITDAITIEAWGKFNSFTTSPCILSRKPGSYEQYWWDIRGSGTSWWHGGYTDVGGACYDQTAYVFETDKWYHLVWTYNKIRSIAYINGAEESNVGKTCTLNSGVADLYIGVRGGATQWFDGSIDEVRIYAVALTASQIKRRYEQTKRDYVRAS